MTGPLSEHIPIDGRTYLVDVRRVSARRTPEIAVAIASHNARDLTRLAVDSVLRWTDDRCEVWVVDNMSTDGTVEDLLGRSDCNVILNRTPVATDRPVWLRRLLRRPGRRASMSYSNGVALELAARHATARWLFVMHNDSLVAHPTWLPFLLSKVGEQTRGVAMWVDTIRTHAMHSAGSLLDLSLVRGAGLSFLPDLPRYDVSDAITLGIRRLGFGYHVCANTYNRPETAAWIRDDHPFRDVHCARAFDDDRNMIFAHLGRGTLKVAGRYTKPGRMGAATWVDLGRLILSAVPSAAGPIR